ncbi:hypothetical protein [Aneurinibacillus migulanus]|uniref:Ead/Ea22-like family protein n=1 Tax=Aneurinibacillus migulanus TaxID=47500 RepID=A0A0D1WCB1_ANEMI|nr:hypothetical protein [Aneurinibacillus migulanus]KIV56205.1 hypothetical protein TS65_13360 [Aneurinibacillus migulanus]KON84268.1 hypothetical protein AF333_30505 [Aneurinibacillus migulanus]MED0893815.1 hypothetical protein [Aneurinibacillus migulanus]MED1614494.1 hypothetical protein [Aneurinibacillus migulanus]SDI83641.1 hypothetical protein SAMN04487909_108115 [Aneurinibacillus migulanus]
MTDQELKEIRERLEAATPGPWDASGSPYGINVYALDGITICEKDEATRADFMNADFIAKAPTDIRRLLDEVKRLRDENRSLEIGYTAMCDLNPEHKQYVETLRKTFIERVIIKE